MPRELITSRQRAPWLAPAKPIRLLLVGEQAVPRAGIRTLIESQANIVVVGEAASCIEAVEAAARTSPDIILLDPDVRGDRALEALPELVTASEGVRLLVLTGSREEALHLRALRAGAMGVVLKDQTAATLIKAIERVHAGEAWVDRKAMSRVLAGLSKAPEPPDGDAARLETLTRREREVLALVAEGLRNRRIADRLFISETTVRHHLTAIFRKLGVSNRLELLVLAYERLTPLARTRP